MKDMQTRVLTAIEQEITDRADVERDAVLRAQWANTGSVYAMAGLDTHLTVEYAFQDDYCTITLGVPERDLTDLLPDQLLRDSKAVFTVNYTDGQGLRRVVTTIRLLLDALAP